jgi:hypothetical protein
MTLHIEILNPKANKLLESLADLNLINIQKDKDDGFMKLLNKLRQKAKSQKHTITMEEITKEVESVRHARYAMKRFDTVKVFRKIKEKIAKETENMTFDEFKAYLNKNQISVMK